MLFLEGERTSLFVQRRNSTLHVGVISQCRGETKLSLCSLTDEVCSKERYRGVISSEGDEQRMNGCTEL